MTELSKRVRTIVRMRITSSDRFDIIVVNIYWVDLINRD